VWKLVADRIGHLENEVLEDLPVCVGPACREDIILVRWPSELFLVPGEALLPWSFSLRSYKGFSILMPFLGKAETGTAFIFSNHFPHCQWVLLLFCKKQPWCVRDPVLK
jgi:hypothetical protein